MQFPRSTLESLNKECFSRISLRSWLFRKWLGAPVIQRKKIRNKFGTGQYVEVNPQFFSSLITTSINSKKKIQIYGQLLQEILKKNYTVGSGILILVRSCYSKFRSRASSKSFPKIQINPNPNVLTPSQFFFLIFENFFL